MRLSLAGLALLIASFATAAEPSQEYRVEGSRDARVQFVCVARNIGGRRFSAIGTDQVLTEEQAMRNCEQESFRCFPVGCTATNAR